MYRIVEANDSFVLIDKSPGVSVHKDQADTGLVMQVQQDLANPQLSPVHRLDKVTSGLMLLACNPQVAAELSAAFRERQVEKYYLALSDRKPRKKQGLVRGDMEKARRGAWKLTKSQNNPAVTQFFSYSVTAGQRLFVLRPRTGKTHQLRVALKSIGAPIIGDELYHEQTDSRPDRAYLHAWALAFTLAGKDYRFVCPPRCGELFTHADFTATLATLAEDPFSLNWPTI